MCEAKVAACQAVIADFEGSGTVSPGVGQAVERAPAAVEDRLDADATPPFLAGELPRHRCAVTCRRPETFQPIESPFVPEKSTSEIEPGRNLILEGLEGCQCPTLIAMESVRPRPEVAMPKPAVMALQSVPQRSPGNLRSGDLLTIDEDLTLEDRIGVRSPRKSDPPDIAHDEAGR